MNQKEERQNNDGDLAQNEGKARRKNRSFGGLRKNKERSLKYENENNHGHQTNNKYSQMESSAPSVGGGGVGAG